MLCLFLGGDREGNITSYANDTITYRYGVLLCQSLFFMGIHILNEKNRYTA